MNKYRRAQVQPHTFRYDSSLWRKAIKTSMWFFHN